MIIKKIVISVLLLSQSITPKFKAICIDVTAICTTSKTKASGFLGIMDPIKYIKEIGHAPSKEDLFQSLKNVPAQSTYNTYNDGIEMPLIFTDWLVNKQPNNDILKTCINYIQQSSAPAIKKTVLSSILQMMLNPQALASVQAIDKTCEKLLQALKKQGYALYLVGNWSHIDSLKKTAPALFALFKGILVSETIKLAKPLPDAYRTIMNHIQLTAKDIVWIEKEPKFIAAAQALGLSVVSFDPNINNALKALKVIA